jgi:homoserine kinase
MSLPSSVTVHAPATIANVGCGFDVLGLCLTEPYDTIRLTRRDRPGLTIRHLDDYDLPTDPNRNVAGAALLALLREVPEAIGFEVEITKGIRPGSGIGSSAASAAGAVVAANALLGNPFTNKQLVDLAMYGEAVASGVRHADNIAPAIFGGFTLVRAVLPALDVVALPPPAAVGGRGAPAVRSEDQGSPRCAAYAGAFVAGRAPVGQCGRTGSWLPNA